MWRTGGSQGLRPGALEAEGDRQRSMGLGTRISLPLQARLSDGREKRTQRSLQASGGSMSETVMTFSGKAGDALHQWPVAWWWAKKTGQKFTCWLEEQTCKLVAPLF